MFLFTFTGVTAEHFGRARQQGVNLSTDGPGVDEVWALIGGVWRVAPRQAMPLLLGVHDLASAEDAAEMVGGVLRELTANEARDLLELLDRGGASCP